MSPLVGFAYLVLGFALLDTCFTLFATPYAALGAELSADYHERTQLAAARGVFHVLGLFLGGLIPGVVLSRYGVAPSSDEGGLGAAPLAAGGLDALRTGFMVMGVTIGACMAAVALATGLLTRERATPSGTVAAPSWRAFTTELRGTLGTRAFRVMTVTFAVILVGGGLNRALLPYAFRYWLAMPGAILGVIVTYLAASLVSVPIWTRLARSLGKDRALRVCMLWAAMVLGAIPLALAPEMSTLQLGAFLALAGLGNGGWLVLPVAIVADVVDQDELATGARREGAFFGVWTLAMKLADALANGVFAVVMWLVGYAPNAAQNESAILGIKLLYGPIPAVCMLLAFATFWRFPLTRERHAEIRRALDARR